jgi:hypothetical protein
MADISTVPEKIEPFKMSKKHKKMFINALRSGDYEQIEGAYIEHEQGPNGKPCLCAAGVYLAQLNELADLYDAQEEHDMCSIDFGDFFRYQNNEDNDLMGHIIDMNDGMNVSFGGIADWIDENVEATD